MAALFELPKTKSTQTIKEILDIMRKKNVDEFLINEIKEDGLGVDLFKEANESNGKV